MLSEEDVAEMSPKSLAPVNLGTIPKNIDELVAERMMVERDRIRREERDRANAEFRHHNMGGWTVVHHPMKVGVSSSSRLTASG